MGRPWSRAIVGDVASRRSFKGCVFTDGALPFRLNWKPELRLIDLMRREPVSTSPEDARSDAIVDGSVPSRRQTRQLTCPQKPDAGLTEPASGLANPPATVRREQLVRRMP